MGSGRHGSGLDPFRLFCAYHLGLTEDGAVRVMNIHQVARLLRVPPDEVRDALARYEMTPEQVIDSGYDLAGAQADLAVAPEGVDRHELARDAWRRFHEARGSHRDWDKELADDAAAIAEDPLFGRRRR